LPQAQVAPATTVKTCARAAKLRPSPQLLAEFDRRVECVRRRVHACASSTSTWRTWTTPSAPKPTCNLASWWASPPHASFLCCGRGISSRGLTRSGARPHSTWLRRDLVRARASRSAWATRWLAARGRAAICTSGATRAAAPKLAVTRAARTCAHGRMDTRLRQALRRTRREGCSRPGGAREAGGRLKLFQKQARREFSNVRTRCLFCI
jgi:hypothetical protein